MDAAMELQVVWNGVNDGCDGDHLIAIRLPAKRAVPQAHGEAPRLLRHLRPPRRQRSIERSLRALREATVPMSALELSFAAKISKNTARRVLLELERDGQVTWSRRPGEYRSVGVYRLSGAGA